ncbi:basic salivary proline-rich protein 2-like [Felis catus]|uniref:basic salivary proline-rich protein 2-like n=1 Tax=Felis catus TaxID=9685 RepID=UPI001D19E8B0|nr:basic salivary proline-rich protein 2-like [Felis catus]XP_044892159.1 basic salivary proline-rich protein 2-like [Felis catus]
MGWKPGEPLPRGRAASPNSRHPSGVRSARATTARALPGSSAPAAPRSPRRTPPGGQEHGGHAPGLPRSPQPPQLGGRRVGRSHPGPQLAGSTADDPSPEPWPPRPERAPPPHTHRGAPSRVLDADARPALTAAAASAEGWSSPPPSPTARGRPAKPPPPPPPPPQQLRPPPRRSGRPAPRPRASRLPPGRGPPPEAQPIGPRARGGGAPAASRRLGRLPAQARGARAVSCAPAGRLSPTWQVVLATLCGLWHNRRTLGTSHLLHPPAGSWSSVLV